MNFPGVYLLHLFVVRGLGAADVAWRVFDLAWLGAHGGRGSGCSWRRGGAPRRWRAR